MTWSLAVWLMADVPSAVVAAVHNYADAAKRAGLTAAEVVEDLRQLLARHEYAQRSQVDFGGCGLLGVILR